MIQNTIDLYEGSELIAGVDEAGRGPLAGSVVAAAVILPPALNDQAGLVKRNDAFSLLTDSKKMSHKQRSLLFPLIQAQSLAWGIAWSDHNEIDALNILQASLLAMRRSLDELSLLPEVILVDGNKVPKISKKFQSCRIEAIVKGDSKVPAISAASVLAKVTRDRQLLSLHEKYPIYNFKQHKGYPTKEHLAMLEQYGPCPEHRFSFSPVKRFKA